MWCYIMLFELIPILKKHEMAAGWLMISFGMIGHGTNLYNTKTGMEMNKMNTNLQVSSGNGKGTPSFFNGINIIFQCLASLSIICKLLTLHIKSCFSLSRIL